eukprot:g44378.t1
MFLCLTFLTNKSSQDQLCFLLPNFYLTNPKTSPKTKVRRALPEATLADKDSFQFRYLLAQEAESRGVAEAVRRFDVTYQKALWWSSKLRGAHPGLHGGHRYQTLSPEAQIALEWTVFLLWEADPNLQDIAVVRLLKYELGWSWLDDGSAGAAIGCRESIPHVSSFWTRHSAIMTYIVDGIVGQHGEHE